MIGIASDQLAATINPLGAELWSLTDAAGRALMTDADPAFWTGRAPLLFPVVGRCRDDRILVDGTPYPMPKHGFARRSPFTLVERASDHATLRLEDSAGTRAAYPFAFRLDARFALVGATLSIDIALTNPAETALPASFGFHPAFAWPLPYGAPREAHQIALAAPEGPLLKRITPEGYATDPVKPAPGQAFVLADALFTDDALVWDPVTSQALRYGPAGGPWLDISWDAPRLGIWTKPGARFVCVEPWHGIADPEGWAGEYRDKPGVFTVPPGETWRTGMRVTLTTG
ncbi:MAG: aldose 1-epimerase family protein [Sphingopyxis sp.]|nr:aldose 1-epimerase family protein [Sphingopyxis sp.]